MAEKAKKIGEIAWVDLTVPDAASVREFYQSVIGWGHSEFDMGDYSDYLVSTPEDKNVVAGICHLRGDNSTLPPHWIVYIKVQNLDESLAACRDGGGKVIAGPKNFGAARFSILEDPGGAVFGVIEGRDSGGG